MCTDCKGAPQIIINHMHTHTLSLSPPLASPAVLLPHLPRCGDDSRTQGEGGEEMGEGEGEICGFGVDRGGERRVSVEKERRD